MDRHHGPAVQHDEPALEREGTDETTAEADRSTMSRTSAALIQMKFAGAAGPGGAEQAHAAAAHGVAGGGAALPHQETIQEAFGPRHDVSGIRAHVGGPAAEATRDLGAEAFATGNDVAFGSAPDLHTAAHEAAHVVQQQSGIQLKGGVGQAGDVHEQEADQVADAVVAGRSAEPLLDKYGPLRARGGSAGALQFKKRTPDAEHVGGEADETESLENLRGKEVVAGQFGFSQIASSQGGADKAAEAHLDDYSGAHMTPVQLDFTKLQAQKDQRTKDAEDLWEQRSWAWGDEAWHQKRLVEGNKWCKKHVEELQQHETDAQVMAEEFNSWTPFANGFFTSLARLEGMQNLLGITDPDAMVAALLEGLDDADAVASTMIDTKGQHTAKLPPADSSVAVEGRLCVTAFREMNTEYLEYQQNLLGWLSADVNSEGDDERAKLAEIERTKATIKQIGGMVDMTMGQMKAAPGRISAATEGVARTKAKLGATMNRRAILNGEKETWNPTFTTTDEDGNIVIRNEMTQTDTVMDVKTGDVSKTASPAGEGLSIPTSVGDVVGLGVDLLFAGEIAGLQRQLNMIATKVAAIDASKAAQGIKHKTETFQRAVERFGAAALKLQKTIEQRRNDYLNFGMQLDSFAAGNKETKKQGLAPEKGGERYATIMMMVAQIRETLQMGDHAVAGLKYQDTDWSKFIIDADAARRALPGDSMEVAHPPSGSLKMPESESKPMWSAYGQIKTYKDNQQMMKGVLGPVDERTQALMKKIGADQAPKSDKEGGGPSNY